ncbi:hypothetical protein QMO56_05545 [Roseomonas sp. E05]|uniref:hypothetical protein n=1 Tax=Roseomonas sp. E05 TaxID=3046310 RepID=UPI0024B94E88|nr:hypothetical protein [Roseomonas sp. E05]MDJ0387570.1 hypothetical protein [Roseomonas sp. E05]
MTGRNPDEKAPTHQGLGAQGPGNAHGIPPEHEPDTAGKPFDPGGGQPAPDPQAAADALLRRANPGQRAGGKAGPEAAGSGTSNTDR